MKYFKHLREEVQERKDPKSKTLHAFDMDEVLFHHDHSKLKVHVKDQNGKRVQSLTNTEYNDHKLASGQSYDYSDFKSHKVFQRSAHPIHKMINKLRAIHNNNKNVEIVTARSDMDDKHGFMKTLNHHGIDTRKIHVRRAGNLNAPSPAEAKHRVIGDLIRKHGYKKVHLYDDSHANLNEFLKLKDDHPDVEFHAHHVSHDPETGHVKITTTKA